MEAGVNANIKTLLAFMNQMTHGLGIEELYSLDESRNLIPILINLIKTGHLTFVCEQNSHNFFSNATKFLSNEFGEAFVKHLNPENADQGDQLGMAIIILALIYALRLSREITFSELCEGLDETNNLRIADMIEKLDNFERWSTLPFSTILCGQTQTNSMPVPPAIANRNMQMNITLPTESNKENMQSHKVNNGNELPMQNRSLPVSSYPLRTTPTLMRSIERRNHQRVNFDSPVQRVLSSPRGDEVIRIHALSEEVKSLREFRDALGREKDRLDEQCQVKDDRILYQDKEIKDLESRIARLLPLAERVPLLEDRIISLEENNLNLDKELRAEKNRNAASQGIMATVRFERDEALKRLEMMQGSLAHMQAENEKTLQWAKDEREIHEQTRQKLAESEERYHNETATFRAKMRQMEDNLEEERNASRVRINQKEREVEELMQMINEIKERSDETNQKSKQKISKLNARIKELLREKEELNTKLLESTSSPTPNYHKFKKELDEEDENDETIQLQKIQPVQTLLKYSVEPESEPILLIGKLLEPGSDQLLFLN